MNTGRGSTKKIRLVSKSLIATAFIGDIQCHVLSSHPEFLIFSDVELRGTGWYLQPAQSLIFPKETFDSWVCSCALPT